MPVLDFLENKGAAVSDPVRDGDVRRLASMLEQIRVRGAAHHGLTPRQFKTFGRGDRREDAMCEFKFGDHRILGFKLDGRVLLLTNGFRKPGQDSTPPEEVAEARRIMAEDRGAQGK